MSEEIIHINVDFVKTGSHHVAISETRLWPPLLSFLHWLVKNPIPGRVADGMGLTILNNLAIIVEGFITDLILDHLKQSNLNENYEVINPDRATWSIKKNVYNDLFLKKLETYPHFPTVEIIFHFRNNIAHGRTHSELSKTDINSGQRSILESENRAYQIVREFLITKRLMQLKDVSSNIDVLWKVQNAIILFYDVRTFLLSVIKDNETQFKEGITSELNYACGV